MGMREEEDHTEEVGRRKGWGKKYRGGEEDEGQVFVKMSKPGFFIWVFTSPI